MNRWIDNPEYDPNPPLQLGDMGFLVSRAPQGQATIYNLYDRPAHTNQSHEPTLHGWCGTTNNCSINAHGIGRVTRTTKNGRAQIETVTDPAEIAAFLDEAGYPELAEQTP